jgi:hypothetical protein
MSPQRLRFFAALGITLGALAVPATVAGQDLRSPDARDTGPVVRAADDMRSPDSRDAGDGRGTFNAPDVMVVELDKPTAAPAPSTDGIDWADVGIGAGGLLALAALALGGAFIVAHRRSATTTA